MNHQDKPVCTRDSPAPLGRDACGFPTFNSLYRHPDVVVRMDNHEGYFKGNDIVIVTRPYVTSATFQCPHCVATFGYTKDLNKFSCLPSTFWKPGELDNYDRIDAGDMTV